MVREEQHHHYRPKHITNTKFLSGNWLEIPTKIPKDIKAPNAVNHIVDDITQHRGPKIGMLSG